MSSKMPDKKNSPTANDFPSRMPFSQLAGHNFMPIAPIAPLAISLPLYYNQPNYGSFGDNFLNVKGDAENARGGLSYRKEVTVEQFTRLALKGCDIAENIVHNHKNRPCFKKIDSLCARLKQDLVRSDSVLANINSQGIAWAVKDMIFTFTRIVNAWIIVKGYMYDVPPGLKKVKESCSGGFDDSFFRWQEATTDFLGNLVDSFEKLDNLVQTQKNRLGSNGKKMERDNGKKHGDLSDESKEDDFFEDLNQGSSVIKFLTGLSNEPKADTVPDGGYIRTGVYNPLQTTNSNQKLNPEQLLMWEENVFHQKSFVKPEKPVKILTSSALAETGNTNEKPPSFLSNKFKGDQLNHEDMLILILLSKLYEMKDASLFFNKNFTKNYVPEYVNSAFTCKDTKTIMTSIEKGSYLTVSAIVKDLADIVYDAKSFLKKHPKHDFLAANTKAFENELKAVLNEEIFAKYDFNHIFIDP